ncbi:MAG: DUF4097 family beta strand repeat-containing protein [Ruminococcus sp.]|nr:DUF4097 family beta strand repeat-containing protein [Ruminococcus sp.]
MRKSIRVLLIIASSLVGFGILCMCLSFALGGADMIFKPKENSKVTIMSATFDEVDVINVKEVSNDVKIIKSEDNQVKVTYGVSDKFSYYLKQVDDTLYVEYDDFRHWYDYIVVFGKLSEPDLIIEVPEKTLNELNVKCTSGDIEAKSVDSIVTTLKTHSGFIEVGGNVGDLTATSTSGGVKLNADIEAECAAVSATSGKLTLSGNIKGDMIADNTSGGIDINELTCINADIRNTSGKIKGESLRAETLKADNISGGIRLTDVVCTGDMTLEATSGSINLESVDAENYDLHTTSGSIKAEILTSKIYNVKTTSGSEKTPEFDEAAEGVLSAKTTSGNIKIELAD